MSKSIESIRGDFPNLDIHVNNKPLVYIDNGATTLKPRSVVDKVAQLYYFQNGNIHRGVHYLSSINTQEYEDARLTVQTYINAASNKEIIFTSGATASINTVSNSFGDKFIGENDEIIVSRMEHHANIVPWKMLCDRKGAKLKVIDFEDDGTLNMDHFKSLVNENTKFVSVCWASNTLGTVNPVKDIVDYAHSFDIPVLIDAAQAIQHFDVDVQELDCDFLVFSGHKLYAPTGIGVLYGKEKWLEQMPPFMGGGDMIKTVSFDKIVYNELPFKFEAGTMHFTGAIAMAEAIKYIQDIGIDVITAQEHFLLEYATDKLKSIEGLKIYGESPNKIATISFLIDGIHHLDIGMVLDKMGVAIRTGRHCTDPIMTRFGIDGTARASFAFYNTKEDVDALYNALLKVVTMFK